MKLRDYQQEAVDDTLKAFETQQAALVVLATGLGKCLGRNTPVLLTSGKIAAVQDIRRGDEVMGPDGKPRLVTSATSGKEQMYRVTPAKGEPYECNESHILSLKITGMSRSAPGKRVTDSLGRKFESGDIVHIDVKSYCASSTTFKHCAKGYRAGVEHFADEREPTIDPYILGIWLADGSRHHCAITTADPEVVRAIEEFCDEGHGRISGYDEAGKAKTYRICRGKRVNLLKDHIACWGLAKAKRIPFVLKTASVENRLQLLAGILDGDGYLGGGCQDYVSKYSSLAKGVAFLARSLGLAAYVKECRKQCCNTGVWGTYYRVCISGDIDMIPFRVERRKPQPRRQKKDVLVTGIKVEAIGMGCYYGFTLDGPDRRFLLGDFTVTHNTVIAAHIAKPFLGSGRVLMLAHRAELIYQGAHTMQAVTGEEPDLEMGEQWAKHGWLKSKIVMSTIQTQIAGREGGRMTRFDPDDFSLLIVDEAHHGVAASYVKVIEHYRQNPNLKILGLTATPDRADEKALGKIFNVCSCEYDIRQGVDGGWLVPVAAQSVYVEGLDFSDVRTTAGDLNGADLAAIMEYEENIHTIVGPTIELTGDRKTLIFAVTVAQAERMTEILNRHKGQSAEVVTGGTPKDVRMDLFKRYKQGDFQYLVNVGVATEGFDEPSIETIVMARPTKSRSLFAQMAGRGTRPLPGLVDGLAGGEDARRHVISQSAKPELQILDFVGNAGRHKLVHMADILGGNYSDEIIELAQKMEQESDVPRNVATDLQEAEREIARRYRLAEEARRRQGVKAHAKYSTAKINPFSVLDCEPAREKSWHKGRVPSDKQIAALEKFGVDCEGLTFTGASKLMDTLIGRIKKDQCSYKQAKFLKSKGVDPVDISFKKAHQLMDCLAQNHWQKTPRFQEILNAAG